MGAEHALCRHELADCAAEAQVRHHGAASLSVVGAGAEVPRPLRLRQGGAKGLHERRSGADCLHRERSVSRGTRRRAGRQLVGALERGGRAAADA